MSVPQTCLYIDDDQVVISDVRMCIDTLGFELKVAKSLAEAREALASKSPTFVICRLQIAGHDFLPADVRTAAKDAGIQRALLPIFVLDDEHAIAREEERLAQFDGTLVLPVEFPSFPLKLRSYLGLDDFSASKASPEASKAKSSPEEMTSSEEVTFEVDVEESAGPDESSSSVKREGAKDAPASETESKTGNERKLIAVYALQLEVLSRLSQDEDFRKGKVRDVPELLRKVTAEVCESSSIDELFS